MRDWYSNRRPSWVVIRGLLALSIGSAIGYAADVDRSVWITILGVPVVLTVFNLISREP